MENLNKYVSDINLPCDTNVTDDNAKLFYTELNLLICGKTEFDYCEVKSFQKFIDFVRATFTVYSTMFRLANTTTRFPSPKNVLFS